MADIESGIDKIRAGFREIDSALASQGAQISTEVAGLFTNGDPDNIASRLDLIHGIARQMSYARRLEDIVSRGLGDFENLGPSPRILEGVSRPEVVIVVPELAAPVIGTESGGPSIITPVEEVVVATTTREPEDVLVERVEKGVVGEVQAEEAVLGAEVTASTSPASDSLLSSTPRVESDRAVESVERDVQEFTVELEVATNLEMSDNSPNILQAEWKAIASTLSSMTIEHATQLGLHILPEDQHALKDISKSLETALSGDATSIDLDSLTSKLLKLPLSFAQLCEQYADNEDIVFILGQLAELNNRKRILSFTNLMEQQISEEVPEPVREHVIETVQTVSGQDLKILEPIASAVEQKGYTINQLRSMRGGKGAALIWESLALTPNGFLHTDRRQITGLVLGELTDSAIAQYTVDAFRVAELIASKNDLSRTTDIVRQAVLDVRTNNPLARRLRGQTSVVADVIKRKLTFEEALTASGLTMAEFQAELGAQSERIVVSDQIVVNGGTGSEVNAVSEEPAVAVEESNGVVKRAIEEHGHTLDSILELRGGRKALVGWEAYALTETGLLHPGAKDLREACYPDSINSSSLNVQIYEVAKILTGLEKYVKSASEVVQEMILDLRAHNPLVRRLRANRDALEALGRRDLSFDQALISAGLTFEEYQAELKGAQELITSPVSENGVIDDTALKVELPVKEKPAEKEQVEAVREVITRPVAQPTARPATAGISFEHFDLGGLETRDSDLKKNLVG